MPHPYSLEKNRLAYLFLFLAANSLIAYSSLPVTAKWLVGLFAILLPLYTALRTLPSPARNEDPGFLTNLKFSLPPWILLSALLLAAFLRFNGLTTLFCWPTLDEGWNGTLAIELSKHWSWRFFYTFGEAPPLPVWCAAALFKLGASPAFALWFPSAAVSLLTVLVGSFAARQFFSRSFSLLCGGLLAFSYWPLFIGRFCHQGVWLPLWVCLVLYSWGGFQNAREKRAKRNWAWGLGAAVGLGSFTFTPWLGVAGIFFLSILWTMTVRVKKDRPFFLHFLLALAVSLVPFLLAVAREGYGHHIASLSPWGGWFKGFEFFTNFSKYFAVLFWGAFEKDPAYTPVWGGFLNPLWGAFFFLGLIEMIRLRSGSLIRWTGAAFLLFLLPGALSPNLETFRVAQVLPLLLFMTALGAHSFLAALPGKKQGTVLLLLLAGTAAFDFNLLTAPYRDPEAHPENFGRPLKSLERYRAYRALSSQPGPSFGFILTDLDTGSFNDPSLLVMTYPFNAANPDFKPPARPSGAALTPWIGFFVNAHYEPFLKSRFPADVLSLIPTGGENLLGILSLNDSNKKGLERWVGAHFWFRQADQARFSQNYGHLEESVQTLEKAFPIVRGDRFLEAVYWDKMAAYAYEDLDYERQLNAYRMAVLRGYPTADLYYKMGQLYLVRQHIGEAWQAFRLATKAPLDRTPAARLLQALPPPKKVGP